MSSVLIREIKRSGFQPLTPLITLPQFETMSDDEASFTLRWRQPFKDLYPLVKPVLLRRPSVETNRLDARVVIADHPASLCNVTYTKPRLDGSGDLVTTETVAIQLGNQENAKLAETLSLIFHRVSRVLVPVLDEVLQ